MKYTLFGENGDYDEAKVLYESTKASKSVMKRLLARRGFLSKSDIEAYLSPSYDTLVQNPLHIIDMEKGAKRIVDALRKGERICIYSDYDCDGIPGGTVLSDFFDHIGYTNRAHYIPHRHKEGYGINKPSLDFLLKDGVTLMITVDNGITNVGEVAYAEEIGIQAIVTDHHLPLRDEEGKQILPQAFAVINSKRDECTYHDRELAGCAVAWKLASAVLILLREDGRMKGEKNAENASTTKTRKKKVTTEEHTPEYEAILEKVRNTKEGFEKWWLDLVAISTIADMVHLQKENRALAYYGLKVLQKSARPGLQKLLTLSKTKQAKLTAMDIAFTIAPRVNAASRMSDPILGYHMLRSREPAKAIASAEELEKLNTLRKDTVKGIKKEVMGFDFDIHDHVVVLGSITWGPGVLGLIAQEVFDETGKPTFVWGAGEQEHEYKGSCRAPATVNLVELMSACVEGTFLGFGGHAAAGGFSVAKEKVEMLRAALNASYEKLELSHVVPEEEVMIDASLTFDQVNNALYKEISLLEPCGVGNPRPLFAFTSNGALSVREFGKQGGHFEIMYAREKEEGRMWNVEGAREAGGFARQEETVKAIYFFGEEEKLALARVPHTLIAELEESHFGWKPELRLRVVDIVERL